MSTDRPALLIVDDDENIRKALRRCLRGEPYDLWFAAGGDQALELIERQPISLILADHLMPGMTGLELLKTVRNLYPQVMRLMLTGDGSLDTAVAAINQGEIYRFLTKPWDDVDLRITLHLAVEHLSLQRENAALLEAVRRQAGLIHRLDERYPGIAEVQRDRDGSIVISEEELAEVWDDSGWR